MPDLTISQHAKERYAERIKDINDRSTIAVYVVQNEEKITNDISKMIEYGELLYSGKNITNQSNNKLETFISVYLNGLWIIIVDKNKNQVITLYPIDLGIDDELNHIFVDKLKDKIKKATEYYEETKNTVTTQIQDLRAQIVENEATILNYRKIIKGLEDYNETSKELISKMNIQVDVAENGIRELIAKLIGKKTLSV